MVVLLVIVTFAIFIAIDMLMSRKRAPAIPMVTATNAAAVPAAGPTVGEELILGGFRVPANLRYHAGHTWMQRERKSVHRVGADEFAAVVAGPVDAIEMPKAGQWVRQGQKVFSFLRGDARIEMVSPVEGEVLEVNADILADPSLLREDPYGRGWLMTVFAPDEEGPSRNLLPSNLLRSWMKEASEAFYGLQPQLAGATAADGGRASKDATANMPAEEWKKAAKVLLLG
jgi:glycine cleavage system H protein